jgi:hypothetical protein
MTLTTVLGLTSDINYAATIPNTFRGQICLNTPYKSRVHNSIANVSALSKIDTSRFAREAQHISETYRNSSAKAHRLKEALAQTTG